ncbi:hypothetical protein JFU47_12225 [Pseudomonas sp. TH39(2020)]|uniref:hypothetical protein n=1 Tax=Pseudomonas sp. TH39(2020) TaxID=2796349 RepID=UPI00191393FD|nr:hypothetical protein [Pseudomonas sp. TH39(2020)]MBK5397463.1 hypothetical protein [Pseudomonas sp. TH39(2020)]
MTLRLSTGLDGKVSLTCSDPSTLERHTELHAISCERELERISFSRSREVNIDWDQVINSTPLKPAPYMLGIGVEYLRGELERLWGFPNGIGSDAEVASIEIFTESVDPPLVIFSIPYSTRLYTIVLVANQSGTLPPLPPAFKTVTAYNKFWASVETISSRDGNITEMSCVDLAPAIIYRQYRELIALRKLGDALSNNADKIASRELDNFLSIQDIDALTVSYLQMKSLKTDVELKLERLRDRARDLGYYLALEKETITLPDGNVDELEAGQIYQPFATVISWETVHHRRVLVRSGNWLFGNSSWVMQVPYKLQHMQQVIKYRKTIPDFDPWIEKERELNSAGFMVYRFVRLGEKYLTTQGESIEAIVERCEIDVNFSKRCAVLIPVYEQGLATGEVLSRYIVILRPRRGTQPVHLPRLFIEEDLLFSTHFDSVEVGEVVESINLAPGEEREILIEKTTLSEQEVRRTATSISDLTESDRIDLSTEMEREATNSSERTTTQNMSAKVGGSYGLASGSAEGSTSSTQTTRQFARDLQKVANKASRSVTRQTRQELKTESVTKVSTSSRQSTKITIRNINDGRALNLIFYQLYNIYTLSLRLERMSFTLLSGREIIAGSGIVLPEVYSLDQLSTLIERMDVTNFPIQPNTSIYPNDPQKSAQNAYKKIIVKCIKTALEEYKVGKPDSSGSIEVQLPPDNNNSPADTEIALLAKELNKIQYTGSLITPPGPGGNSAQTLVIGSPGLYLDSNVGVRPSTEPYSEEMRTIEIAKGLAEVHDVESRANYSDALARRLSRVEPGNVVTGSAVDLRNLTLTFEKPPLIGDWSLYVANAFVRDFRISNSDLVQHISFTNAQQWLKQSNSELARIVHKSVEQELAFVI